MVNLTITVLLSNLTLIFVFFYFIMATYPGLSLISIISIKACSRINRLVRRKFKKTIKKI